MFGYQFRSVRVLRKITHHPNLLRKSWETLKKVNQKMGLSDEPETHLESIADTGRKNKIITINRNEKNEIQQACTPLPQDHKLMIYLDRIDSPIVWEDQCV